MWSLLKKQYVHEEDTGAVNRGFELDKDLKQSCYGELTDHWMELKVDPLGLIS